MVNNEGNTKNTAPAATKMEDRDYWLEKFSGEWQKRAFPYDHNLKAGATSAPGTATSFTFELAGENFLALQRLSNQSEFRSFMVLTAQLSLLLYKYTGAEDIFLGAPIVKQEIDGDFINSVLPLRIAAHGRMTFKQLLLHVREILAQAEEHQNYPMDALLHKLGLEAGDGHFPLFDVTVLLENIHDPAYIRHISSSMMFRFHLDGDRARCVIEYNPGRYTAVAVETLARRFTLLSEEVMSNLDTPLAEISILSEKEREQVMEGFNDTRQEYPADTLIHRLIEEQALATPEATAVVDPPRVREDDPQPRSYTYRQLNEKANQLAHLMREKKVGPGTVVGLLMEAGIDRVAAVLGILKAGAAYLPIDTESPEQRVTASLEQGGASLLVTHCAARDKYTFTRLQNLHAPMQKTGEEEDTGTFRIHVTPRRPSITDFNRLSFPDRSLVDYGRYSANIGHAVVKGTVSIQATRGCPYNCAFCHKIWPKTHVYRSAENIFEEVNGLYQQGVRRISFVDDIFNLNRENSTRFFRMLIENNMNHDIQVYFPNGLRGDILTPEYIDLMVEAGVKGFGIALESAVPRLQKMISKNIHLERLRENLEYMTRKYPQVFLEMFTMIGFPTETEEEAMQTFEFIKSIHWIDFAYVFILKVYPNTDMEKLALENGVSPEAIRRSADFAYHQLPDTLPFSDTFALQLQTRFTNEYFLNRERLLHVLPYQLELCSEDELMQKYDNYLPMPIETLDDLLRNAGISREELGEVTVRKDDGLGDLEFFRTKEPDYPPREENDPALRILFLDLSNHFSSHGESLAYRQVIEPLGLMYLLTHLRDTFGDRVMGHIAKARIDFDGYGELRDMVHRFQPDVIGIRTLSFYKDFFHETTSFLRHIGVTVPIITGGPYATSDFSFILRDPNVDLVVMGEGENTTVELVHKILENNKGLPGSEVLKTIPGIAFNPSPQVQIPARDVMVTDRLEPELQKKPATNPEHVNKPEDLLYMISTSGSTGTPKSVMLEHRNLANLLHYQFQETDIDFSHRVLQFAAISFDVSAQEMFSTLARGGCLYLADMDLKADVARLSRLIEDNQISVLFLPPSFLKMVFTEPDYAAIFPTCVKHIIAAGEQLIVPPAFRDYLQKNKVTLHNHYGPSETHVVTALTLPPDSDIPQYPNIGTPIANTRIYILDPTGAPTPPGIIGELHIAGANVGRGYYRQPELTAEKFSSALPPAALPGGSPRGLPADQGAPITDGFYKPPGPPTGDRQENHSRLYRTGDLARWMPDGTIEFRGRKDHQVKIRGFRIELQEIENHLLKEEEVREAAVIDRDTGAGGDKFLCAYYVSETGEDVPGLRDRLLNLLPEYMMPAHFIRLDNIPKTAGGKIDRRNLPAPDISSGTNYTPPSNDVEQKLVDIWAELLELSPKDISIDANFFELGGHSLKATILISRIHKTFNVKTSLGEMFSQPTIKGLAGFIGNAATETFTTIEPAPQLDAYPMSASQKRMYIANQLDPQSTNYNMPAALLVEGELDREKLEAVFTQMVARQEGLRTRFTVIDGETMQEILPAEDIRLDIRYTDHSAREDLADASPQVLHDTFIGGFVQPFDLSQTPLLRVGLIKIAEQKHLLMVDIHHIIGDGFSLGILVREFTALYEGRELPPLPTQYKDYAWRQKKLEETGELKRQEDFWRTLLEEDIPELNLPLDFPRPERMSFEGRWLQFDIGPDTTARLKELAKQQDATMYMLLLAAYNILLHKVSGNDVILVGSAVAGRTHPDLENIIGVFLNTLVQKNRVTGDLAFKDFLAEVRDNTLRAFDNQDYQFDTLVEALGNKRDYSRHPIFDTVFNFHNMELPEVKLPGLTITPIRPEVEAVKFDMKLMAQEWEDILRCTLDYGSRLFEPQTMEALVEDFKKLLDMVAAEPEITISSIRLASDQTRRELINDFSEDLECDF